MLINCFGKKIMLIIKQSISFFIKYILFMYDKYFMEMKLFTLFIKHNKKTNITLLNIFLFEYFY